MCRILDPLLRCSVLVNQWKRVPYAAPLLSCPGRPPPASLIERESGGRHPRDWMAGFRDERVDAVAVL